MIGRKRVDLLASVVMALLVWLLAGFAQAETSISLELEADEQPTHVCVISTARKDKHDVSLAELENQYKLLSREQGEWVFANQGFIKSPDLMHTSMDANQQEFAALLGLVPEFSAYGDRCRTQGSALGCEPSFSVLDDDEKRFIQCVASQSLSPTEQAQAKPEDLRVLIVSIEDPGEGIEHKIAISDLKLFDSILEFDSSHKPSSTTILASVRGGYYATEPAVRVGSDATAKLVLTPRCQWMTLVGPPILMSENMKVRRKSSIHVDETPHDAVLTQDEKDEKDDTPRQDRLESSDPVRYGQFCVRGDLYKADMRVLVPARVSDAKLEVTLAGPSRDSNDEIRLRGRWMGDSPVSLVLETLNFTFSWKSADCFSEPEGKCPIASIHESGVECTRLDKSAENNVCRYSCPGNRDAKEDSPDTVGLDIVGLDPAKLSIDFTTVNTDLDVSDERAHKSVWTRKLNYIDQQLGGSVSAAERVVTITIDPEFRKRHNERAQLTTTGDQVYAVELDYVGYNGVPTSITIDLAEREAKLHKENDKRKKLEDDDKRDEPPLRPGGRDELHFSANLPDATCGNDIRYRYIGERDFVSQRTHIRSGQLRLRDPVELGRVWYPVVTLGAGTVFPRRLSSYGSATGAKVVFGGSLDVGVAHWFLRRRRTSCKDEDVEDAKERICDPTSSARGLRVELRGGLMYSATQVRPLDPDNLDASDSRYQTIPYFRFGPSVTLLPPWFGRGGGPNAGKGISQRQKVQVTAGPGLGVFWGLPVREADKRLFDTRGGGLDFGLRAFVDVRLRMIRAIRLELFMRHEYLLLEDDVNFSTDSRGQSHQSLNESQAFRQGFIFGLHFSL